MSGEIWGDVWPDWLFRPCTGCVHLISEKNATCAAFPDRIPDAIWNGENQHTEPFPGDHGIQYEQTEEGKRVAEETENMTDDEWRAWFDGESDSD